MTQLFLQFPLNDPQIYYNQLTALGYDASNPQDPLPNPSKQTVLDCAFLLTKICDEEKIWAFVRQGTHLLGTIYGQYTPQLPRFYLGQYCSQDPTDIGQ